ncbi:MAG: YchJ family protein [Aureispira sp.]|nr:YchJ family protein [Aureispira sp.]
MNNCPCNSSKTYADCCEPIHQDAKMASTAEDLMRARYSAHTKSNIEFIVATTHYSIRRGINLNELLIWCKSADWGRLEVVEKSNGTTADDSGKVEFKAYYHQNGKEHCHHEISTFKKEKGQWFFADGIQPLTSKMKKLKIGRNSPCTCGSGKKYKQCCGKK